MHSHQREMRTGMVEFCLWFKSIRIMTVRAGRRKRALVVIHMTSQAFGSQSQVGELLGFDRFTGNEFRLMTVLAGFFCMGAGERKPRQVMIKLILIKPEDLKV